MNIFYMINIDLLNLASTLMLIAVLTPIAIVYQIVAPHPALAF